MNLLLIDQGCNTLYLASMLAQESDVTSVVVANARADADVWGGDKIRLLDEPMSISDTIDFCNEYHIDMVVNFSSLLGVAGLVERLRKAGTVVIGADREFSLLEIDKRRFKRFLQREGIRTPRVILEGSQERVIQQRQSISYPVVLKPDRQNGPPVAVCKSEAELLEYFQRANKKSRVAKATSVFLVEECLPFSHIYAVSYYLVGGQPVIETTVKVVFDRKSDSNSDGVICAVSPAPDLEAHMPEIRAALLKLSRYGDRCIGHVQLGISDHDGKAYFLEHNSRPPGPSLIYRESALKLLLSLRDQHAAALQVYFSNAGGESFHAASFVLLHDHDGTVVDYPALMQLPDTVYMPYSVERRGDEYVSFHKRMVSVATVQGNSFADVREKVKPVVSSINAMGTFRPLSLGAIDRVLGQQTVQPKRPSWWKSVMGGN